MSFFSHRLLAVIALCLALAGCKTELFANLSESEANQVIAALMENGIPAAKKQARGEGVTIVIDEARFSEAIEVLNARGLPSDHYASFGEVFKKEGIVSSPIEERARYLYALSQELSRTISEIDGVLSARIHVVLPETDMLGRDFKPSSASVFVRYTPGSPFTQFTSQIKLLVANSIEGLDYDNVNIVAIPATQTDTSASKPMVLQEVIGIWVHPNSVNRFWMIISALGAIATLAAGIAIYSMIKINIQPRSTDSEFDEAGPR